MSKKRYIPEFDEEEAILHRRKSFHGLSPQLKEVAELQSILSVTNLRTFICDFEEPKPKPKQWQVFSGLSKTWESQI